MSPWHCLSVLENDLENTETLYRFNLCTCKFTSCLVIRRVFSVASVWLTMMDLVPLWSLINLYIR